MSILQVTYSPIEFLCLFGINAMGMCTVSNENSGTFPGMKVTITTTLLVMSSRILAPFCVDLDTQDSSVGLTLL